MKPNEPIYYPFNSTIDKEGARNILGRREEDLTKPYILIPRVSDGEGNKMNALAIRFAENGNIDIFMNGNSNTGGKENYNGGDRYFSDPRYKLVQTQAPGDDSPWANHIVISPLEENPDYNMYTGLHRAGKTFNLSEDFKDELHSKYEDRARVLQYFIPEEILTAKSQFLKSELGTDAFKALANTICTEFTNYTQEEPFTLTKTIEMDNGFDENGNPLKEIKTVPKDELDRLVITHSFMNDESVKEKVAAAISVYNDAYKEFRVQEIDYIAKINNNPLIIQKEEDLVYHSSKTFERDIQLSQEEIQNYKDDVEKLREKQNSFLNSVILRRSDKIGEKIAEYEAIIDNYENPKEGDLSERIFRFESEKMFEVKECLLSINKENPLNIHEMNDLMNEREVIVNELRYKELREEYLVNFPEKQFLIEKEIISDLAKTQFASDKNNLGNEQDIEKAQMYWTHLKATAFMELDRDDFVDRDAYNQAVQSKNEALFEYNRQVFSTVDKSLGSYENCFEEFKTLKEKGDMILSNGDSELLKDPSKLYSKEQYDLLSSDQKSEYEKTVSQLQYLSAVMNNHEDRFKIMNNEFEITGEYKNFIETNINEIGKKPIKMSEAVEVMADKYLSEESKAYLTSYPKTLELKQTLENNAEIMQTNLQQVSLRYTEILNLEPNDTNKELAEKTKETFESLYKEYLINNSQLHVVEKHLETQDYQKDYLTGPNKDAYSESFVQKVKEMESMEKMGQQLFKSDDKSQNQFEEMKLSYYKLNEAYNKNADEIKDLSSRVTADTKVLEKSLKSINELGKEGIAQIDEQKIALQETKHQLSQLEAQNHFIEQYVAKREILEKESINEAINQMDVSKLYVLDKATFETKLREDYHESALNQMTLPMQVIPIESVEYTKKVNTHDGNTVSQIIEDKKLELVESERQPHEINNLLEKCSKQDKLLNNDFEVLLNESLATKVSELKQMKEDFEAKYEEKVTNVIIGNDIEKTISYLSDLKNQSTNTAEIEKLEHSIDFCKKADEINLMINNKNFTIEEMLNIHALKHQEKDLIPEYITNPQSFAEKQEELYGKVTQDYSVVKDKVQELQLSQDVEQIGLIKQDITQYQGAIKESVDNIKSMEAVREAMDSQKEALHGFDYKEILDKSNDALLLDTGEKLSQIRSQQKEDLQTEFNMIEKDLPDLQKEINSQKLLKNELNLELDVIKHKISVCEYVCEEDENFSVREKAFVAAIDKEIEHLKGHDDYDQMRLEHFNSKMQEFMKQSEEKEAAIAVIDIPSLQATYEEKLSKHEDLRIQIDCYDKVNENEKWNVLIEEKLQDDKLLMYLKDIEAEIEKDPSLKTVKVATTVEREELLKKEEEFKNELEAKSKENDKDKDKDKEEEKDRERKMSADEYARTNTTDICR